eukprot:4101010-Pleurochrysis_carterae.AAC.1
MAVPTGRSDGARTGDEQERAHGDGGNGGGVEERRGRDRGGGTGGDGGCCASCRGHDCQGPQLSQPPPPSSSSASSSSPPPSLLEHAAVDASGALTSDDEFAAVREGSGAHPSPSHLPSRMAEFQLFVHGLVEIFHPGGCRIDAKLVAVEKADAAPFFLLSGSFPFALGIRGDGLTPFPLILWKSRNGFLRCGAVLGFSTDGLKRHFWKREAQLFDVDTKRLKRMPHGVDDLLVSSAE